MRNKRTIMKEKGITLVALVVTIIVLLILAGVTIRLVLDNNGIIQRAKDTSGTWENASYNEEAMMGKLYNDISTYSGGDGELQGGEVSDEDEDLQGGEVSDGESTEAPDLLKDYVLGAEVNGTRTGRSLSTIYNSSTNEFKNDSLSITDAQSSVTYLNELFLNSDGKLIYIRYDNAAYRVTVTRDNYLSEFKIRDIQRVYKPKEGGMEGQVVSYKAKESDTNAIDWLVLYDNKNTVDIMSLETMGELTLGKDDEEATGTNKALYSYDNAVSRLNAYCGTLVTNIDASRGEKVRSSGTLFNITDTTEKVNAWGREYGKVSDMNAEQDMVRMSYYSAGGTGSEYIKYGYAKTGNSFWLASRREGYDNEGYDVYFNIRNMSAYGGIGFGLTLYSDHNGGYSTSNSATQKVRPVARILKSSL